MTRDGILERYEALDRALASAGFPATSPWWMATIARFLRSTAHRLVLRVGRRGGKSSTLCRLVVVLALFGEWTIPPGDVGVVAFVSVNRDEASQRIRTIEAILRALGVAFRPVDGGIELADRPLAFKTFACTVASVSGPTCVAIVGDEVAKWRNADTGANPADEVLAALRPTTATQPGAIEILSGSPLGTDDAHAKAFDEGDTAEQITAHAATWTANPTVSEETTRKLERDDRRWRREYAAIPQAGAASAFDSEIIDRAFRDVPPDLMHGERIGVIDAASGGGDAFTWAVVSWAFEPGEPEHLSERTYFPFGRTYREVPKLDADGQRIPNPRYNPLRAPRSIFVVEHVNAITGAFFGQIGGRAIVDRISADFRRYGVRHVVGDQREQLMLSAEFSARGFVFRPLPWTNANKATAVETVRAWMRDDRLVIPPTAEKMRAELLGFQERIAPSGFITYGARRGGHDDFAALLLTSAIADADGLISGSPFLRTVRREFPPGFSI